MLVADHLTNAEIAERLALSVRTVESHVTSLIRKLEVPDRRSLARRADADGLLRGPVALAAPRRRLRRPGGRDGGPGRRPRRPPRRDGRRAGWGRQDDTDDPGGRGGCRDTTARRVVRRPRAGRRGTRPSSPLSPRPSASSRRPAAPCWTPLLGVLSRTDGLLLLDNCEHVLAEVERLVSAAVAACPRLTVVATSRARLGATYEWVYELPALNGDDAVRLFRQRAAAAGGPLPQAPQVEELCARLEGMALAIELAAARYPSLGLDGLSTALADPLRLLGDGSTARQRSLRATIAWSVDLLGDEERSVLAACSVFASPFTVAAARRVAGPALTDAAVALALAGLADQHLLRAEVGAPTTYRFLEVVRQYAGDLLGPEAPDATRRHAAWAAEELVRLGEGTRDDAWCADFDRLAVELRVALARPAAPVGLGERFADDLVQRGRLEEAQARYEAAGGRSRGDRAGAAAAAGRGGRDGAARGRRDTAPARRGTGRGRRRRRRRGRRRCAGVVGDPRRPRGGDHGARADPRGHRRPARRGPGTRPGRIDRVRHRGGRDGRAAAERATGRDGRRARGGGTGRGGRGSAGGVVRARRRVRGPPRAP